MIGQYTLQQWILYFYVYCFLGWIFESCYVSFRKKEWVNRGFLHGPFLPIYGSGAVMMLFVSEPFKNNLILTYFAGVVGATLLELVTGAAMEALLKVGTGIIQIRSLIIKDISVCPLRLPGDF